MFNKIVKRYIRTIRRFNSFMLNLWFMLVMVFKGKYKSIKQEINNDKITINSIDIIKKLYSKYYEKYIKDPLEGIIDYSGNIRTILYRKGGDCDDMSGYYEWAFQTLFDNLKYPSYDYKILVCSFYYDKLPLYHRINRMHVMTIIKDDITNKDYVCDYENIIQIANINAAKTQYVGYIEDLLPRFNLQFNAENVKINIISSNYR